MREYFKTTETIVAVTTTPKKGNGLILTKSREFITNDDFYYNDYMHRCDAVKLRDQGVEVVLYGKWQGKDNNDRFVTNFYTIEEAAQLQQQDLLKLLNAKKITQVLLKSLNFPENSQQDYEYLSIGELNELRLINTIGAF